MPQTKTFTFDPSAHAVVFAPVIDRQIGAILATSNISGSFMTFMNDATNTLTLEYPDGQTLTTDAQSGIQTYLNGYTHNPVHLTADELQHARRNITFGLEMYRQAKLQAGNPDVAYWSTYLTRMSVFTGFSIVKDPIPNAATKAVVDAEVGQTITDLGKLSFYLQYPGSLDANNVVQPTAGWWPT